MCTSRNDIMSFIADRALQNAYGILGSNIVYRPITWNDKLYFMCFRDNRYAPLKRESTNMNMKHSVL